MILQAIYAEQRFLHGQGQIVIRTPDSDVVVLAIHHFRKLNNTTKFWIHAGVATRTEDRRRYIPIYILAESYSVASVF